MEAKIVLTETPFDDLLNLIDQLPEKDEQAEAAMRSDLQSSLVGERPENTGLTSWLAWLAAWQGTSKITLAESHICLFTSSYVGADGIDQVAKFADLAGRGQTPLNQMCKDRGLGLRVLELAPTVPHDLESGWPERDCMAACAFGMEATASGGNVLGLSAISAGSDAVAKDLIMALDEPSLKSAGKKAVLNCMQEQAGREIAALVGAMIAARSRRLPVLAEGWAALCAMKILFLIEPEAIEHVNMATASDAAQRDVLESIGKQSLILPVSDLPAGCGVAVAISTLATLSNLN